MYRFLTLLCALLLAAAPLTAQTNKKIKSLQREQSALKKRLAGDEQLLRSTKKDVNAQLANLQVISAQVEGQEKYVQGIRTELSALGADIARLEQELAALEADLADCKRKYQRAVTYMFRNRMQVSKWQFILSAKNFRQMYRRMRYMTEFARYQRVQGRIIQQKEEAVRTRRAQLLGKKQEKDRLYAEGRAETQKLEARREERRQVVDQLNQKQKQLQSSIAQQRKKAAQLDARIDKLIQEEIAAAERRRKAEAEKRRKAEAARLAREKKERERAAAAARAAKSGKSTGKGGKATAKSSAKAGKTTAKADTRSRRDEAEAAPRFADTDSRLTANFAAQRGRLPAPITGAYTITTRYGQYNVDGLRGVQLDSKGINLTGRPGAQARAVYKGEVTAIFTYGGMYNIIVRHGAYMTVYCNLASAAVRRGQQVEARQSLGSVATDAAGNCTLHFQLRKETAKLNPEGWIAR